MITSILSLLLLVLPGYSLFNIKWIQKKIDLSEIDKFLFGFIIWIFYIVSTVLRANIAYPNYLKHTFLFNYFLGFILIGYWLFKELPRVIFTLSNYKTKLKLMDITLGGTLPFLLPIIAFIVIITLYTPLIYQYDALALYLIEGRQLVDGSSSLAGKWPTFGGSMPVMPIIYSWFFYLSDAPILRLIPLTFFFLTILLVYNMGRKLSPKNHYAAYISVVSLVSMTSLQWYMAKTSLYLDLCLMFFAASSIYALMIALEDESIRVNFLILGINMALLLLSKEYGIFLTWFIIGFIVFSRYNKIFKKSYRSLFYSLYLIMPFSLRIFNYLSIYSFTENRDIMPKIIFQSFIIIISIFIQILIFIQGELKYKKFNFSSLTMAIIPLIFPALFFINNFLVMGSPLGTFKETDIERLYEMGIVFGGSTTPIVSFLKIPNLFLSNGLLAMNLLPLLFFLLNLLMPRMHRIQDKHSKLLTSWFFYSLLLFFYVTSGYIEGGHSRKLLILAIPVALMVGKGIHSLLEHNSLPDYIGNLTYVSSISIFLVNIWFIKLDSTKWWLINLDSLINNFIYAHPIEVILYAVPWLLLFIFIKLRKNNLYLSKIHSKRFWAKAIIIIILISAITPSIIFSQAVRYPKTWDPSFYDEADAVKHYADHWHMPIIDFYRSRLSNDNLTTIGFGVTPLEYFLERSFIDLNHPRNWLLYLPLLQELSTDALLSYLESLDARYFLIPTEKVGSRNRYELALKNSTLFKLIATSEIFSGNDGQIYYFERLAGFSPLVLYVLNRLPNWVPIDMKVGEYHTAQDYDNCELIYNKPFRQNVVLYRINTSVTGYRALHYNLSIPLDFSNVDTVILAIKSNLKGRTMVFRLASEMPWENRIGWRFYIDTENWKFYEFNLSEPNPDVVLGKFDPTKVKQLTLGLAVKLNDPEDIQIYYLLLLHYSP